MSSSVATLTLNTSCLPYPYAAAGWGLGGLKGIAALIKVKLAELAELAETLGW